MKTILILTTMLIALLLSACSSSEDKEKAAEIIRLQIALASQHGTRAAELEYGERQVSFYLGCEEFFNRCSPETIDRGRKLLQLGYTGTMSGWYWAGLFGGFICIAIAVAVFMTLFMHLFLIFIAPKAEKVERARKLVDGVDEYVAEGLRWRAAHEQKMLTKNSALAKVTSEIKKQKNERDEVWRTLTEVYAELDAAQVRLKATQQQKIDAEGFEDY